MFFRNNDELRDYILQHFMGPQVEVSKDLIIERQTKLAEDLPTSFSTNFSTSILNKPGINELEFAEPKIEYLHDNPLSYKFQPSNKKDEWNYSNLSLCLYNINTNSRTPFVEYLFVKNEKMYQFPQAPLNITPFKEISEHDQIEPNELEHGEDKSEDEDKDKSDSDSDEFTEELLNQCSQLFKNIVNNNSTFENLQTKFKGFIESGENGDGRSELFVFFDIGDIDVSDQCTWAILDEIMVKNSIANISIVESNYNLFYNNLLLSQLMKINVYSENTSTPILVYLCVSDNTNAYYSENESSQTTVSQVNTKTTHPVFGIGYVFSTKPFNDTNLSKIKRYSLFINGAVYFLNKTTNINEFILPNSENNVDNISENTSQNLDSIEIACFYKDGVQLFFVREFDAFTEI